MRVDKAVVENFAANGLPGKYDLITTFNVVHDAAHPKAVLRAIREALRPDGIYVCIDINRPDKLEENAAPRAPSSTVSASCSA